MSFWYFMKSTFSIFDLFYLLCGLALFLYGMQQGEKNLKRIGGSDLRRIIAIITRHRISAYFAGFFTTLLTQSSSATTVMLVGLASARLMTLGQSLGMILGSDLGTTFTVQLFAFKFYQIAPLLIASGFFTSLNRSSERLSGYGKLTLALGLIFFGMHMMAQSVTPLRNLPLFEDMLRASFNNKWYGLLAGTLITAIIQSSAATLAIVIALAQGFQSGNGWSPSIIDFFPIVLGANLGTCVTAFLSTLRADLEGVRVAWAHFAFKLIGVILIFPFIGLLRHFNQYVDSSAGVQIALLHTIFNVLISILFLPLLHPFEHMILRIVKHPGKSQQRFQTSYLHERVLSFPVLALSQAVKEIIRMSERVQRMVEASGTLISNYNFASKSRLAQCDDEIDFLHEQIVTFLTNIAREELAPEQASHAYELIMITTDLEHIGDIVSKNIINLAEKIEASPLPLSAEGKQEIQDFFKLTLQNLNEVLAAFTIHDQALAQSVFERKKETTSTFEHLFERHMNRLYRRKPESLQTTSIHVDLLEEIRRINHFTFRIAAHMLKIHNAE